MFLLCDLLFVLVLFVSVYLAGKKGLIGMVRGFVVLVLAALLAIWGNAGLSGVIRDTTIGGGIYEKVETAIGGLLGISPEMEDAAVEGLIESGNNTISAIDGLTSGDLLADLRGQISQGAENLASKLLAALSDAVTGVLLRVIAFLIIFILAYITLRISLRFLKHVTEKDGLVGYANTSLGFVFGVLRGLLLCIVLGNLGVWLLQSFGATRGWDTTALLSQTYLFRFFSNVFAFL